MKWISTLLMSGILIGLPWLQLDVFKHDLFTFLGRFHPLIVHFPIVAVLLSAFFDWWSGSSSNSRIQRVNSILFKIALYTTLVSIGAGYLLYISDDYGGTLMRNHFWGGCLLGVTMLWAYYFRDERKSRKHRSTVGYKVCLYASVVLVVFTGHAGGSLTHGEGFVTEPLARMQARRALNRTTAMQSPQSMQVFGDMIVPALHAKCRSCHNPQKTKGGLDLTSYETMMQGGKSDKPMIVPGDPAASELFVRIDLEPSHDDYMPPEGKPALDPVEKDLIEWWIEKGAEELDTLGSGPEDPVLKAAVDGYIPTLALQQQMAAAQRMERMKIGPKLQRLCFELGLDVRPDPETDSAFYALSMQIPAQVITDETLAELMPYRHVFSKVSLASADITDEGLYYLGQMTNLKELILIKSCIDGSGLAYLEHLPKLRLLNLSHTDTSNENILGITAFPELKHVYLFNSMVDEEMLNALQSYLSDTEVTFEEGPYY